MPLKRFAKLGSFWILLVGLLSGCEQNRLLFATKSIVGLDIDSQPPATELSINRKEGVIEPVFEGGQTPPVLASFKADMNPVARFFGFGIGTTFSTGDAAETLSSLFTTTDNKFDKLVFKECARNLPKTSSAAPEPAVAPAPATTNEKDTTDCAFFKARRDVLSGQFGSWISLTKPPVNTDGFVKPGTNAQLFFGTDTVTGLKIDWQSGGYLPSGAKFGFNRKEVTWAPLAYCKTEPDKSAQCFSGVSEKIAEERQKLIVNQSKSQAETQPQSNQLVHVIIAPSVLATLDSTYALEKQRTGLKYQQYFATGRAATNLAARQHVRRTLLPEFEDGMASEIEAAYLWTGKRLAEKLSTVSDGKTLDRVYAFAQSWKFIDAIDQYSNTTNAKLVDAVNKKMISTEACFSQEDRSTKSCLENRAVANVSAEEMKVMRDLFQLCD